MRDVLKPKEVAELCGVSPDTVRGWCKHRRIKFASTPGGHKRFRKKDILEFLKAHDFPLPEKEIFSIRILVVKDEEISRNALISALQKEISFNVKGAANVYEVGRMIAEFDPEVLFLDPSVPGIDLKLCRGIQARATSNQRRMIFIIGSPDDASFKRVRAAGFYDCVAVPIEDIKRLTEEIRKRFKGTG